MKPICSKLVFRKIKIASIFWWQCVSFLESELSSLWTSGKWLHSCSLFEGQSTIEYVCMFTYLHLSLSMEVYVSIPGKVTLRHMYPHVISFSTRFCRGWEGVGSQFKKVAQLIWNSEKKHFFCGCLIWILSVSPASFVLLHPCVFLAHLQVVDVF